MTFIHRLLLALFCLTLPYTAQASMPSGMGCHGGMAMETAVPQHADHSTQQAGMSHAETHSHVQSVAQHKHHSDCDCAMKCGCIQHCASSCAMPSSMLGLSAPLLHTYVFTVYSAALPDLRTTPLFRPPITALS